MTSFLYFNVASELWGVLLCITCIVCALMMSAGKNSMRRYFIHLFLCDAVLLTSDAIGLLFDGRPGVMAYTIVLTANTVLFVFSFLLLTLFTDYVSDLIEECAGKSRGWKLAARTICYALMLLTLVNMFRPVFFCINENNMYQRSSLFWLSQVAGIVIALINEILVIYNYRKLSRVKVVCLSMYTICPIISMLIQLRFYGLSLLNITTTVLLMVCFLSMMFETNQLIYDQRLALARQETELAESRAQVMLSQIQPHFLYNSLNSIYYLCGKDPKLAQKAVGDFADYLRMNLDSLKTKENIPFAMELKHIQTYLWLEHLRFDDRLNVVYDIECRDFLLPVLTIQPLVENAVKHGICCRPEGGTVTLATRETSDCYEITVSDNGVGFDPKVKKKDGRSHIGLQNVISRIEMEIHGTVEVNSVIGSGTSITVRLPKGDN